MSGRYGGEKAQKRRKEQRNRPFLYKLHDSPPKPFPEKPKPASWLYGDNA